MYNEFRKYNKEENMLQEERFIEIVKLVENRKSITVQELMDIFDASESTIRRDLGVLHANGRLIKVHGGAVACNNYLASDMDVVVKENINRDDKLEIAKYAASLIEKEDFVFLDAGTTTELMIDYITEKSAVFVTNAIAHGRKLARLGFKTFIPGGELKGITEAVVGEDTVKALEKYNFTKGFFGTNGIHIERGFTTPDVKEALVKKQAMEHCKECYILADESKFNQISPVTFGKFSDGNIITQNLQAVEYKKYKNVLEVKSK